MTTKQADAMHIMVLAALDAGWNPPAAFDLRHSADQVDSVYTWHNVQLSLLLAAAVVAADDGQCPDALLGRSVDLLDQRFAKRNDTLRALPEGVQPFQLRALIETHVADIKRANEATASGFADRALASMVKQLQAKHPELGLSYGYIGNCDLYGSRWDDRSWGISTRFVDRETRSSVRFGGVPTCQLGRMMIMAERDLAAWCLKQEERFAGGTILRAA